MTKVLFVLKYRENPYGDTGKNLSSGLLNSVSFVVEMLNSIGITAKAVQVEDNNSIDREVTSYQPSHVVIEAFWVVPEKFDVLKPLHPQVQWLVRNHSEIPFLSNEGIAMEWIAGYLQRGVEVMCNSPRALADVTGIATALGYPQRLVSYGPNYYPLLPSAQIKGHQPGKAIQIGCFGAIRPLKNQLAQAVAAIEYSVQEHKPIEFHVNGTRVEGGGNPILKNLEALFGVAHNASLVLHPWMAHADFLKVMATMDICMQVSFSETFNIVSADAVGVGVPVVASAEVPWLRLAYRADPTSIPSIVTAMSAIKLGAQPRLYAQWHDLSTYNTATEAAWKARFA